MEIMLTETKRINSKYGVGSEWTINGNKFYTTEFFDSGYMDLYEHEASWREAIKTGINNECRIDSIPNVFQDDECEDTFFILSAVFGGCGSITKTMQIINGVFNVTEDGYVYPKNWATDYEEETIDSVDDWVEI